MFSGFFSRALELVGRPFLLSAFFPTLVVALGVALSVDAERSLAALSAWAEHEEFKNQVSSALLLLAGVYLAAYVIYGLREALIWLFQTGWLWLAPLIPGRKNRFIDKRRGLDRAKRRSLSIPNATVWAENGFNRTEQEDNPYKGTLLSSKRNPSNTLKRVDKQLKHLEAKREHFKDLDPLPLRWERKVERLLVDLHFLSFYDSVDVQRQDLIDRISKLGDSENRLSAWCQSIQRRTWTAVADVHSAGFYFPPEKYIRSTALGNVLSWIATYPIERYGINLDVVYPRLQKCIEGDFARLIEDRKTFLDFAVVFATLCYTAAAGFLIYSVSVASYMLTTVTLSVDSFLEVLDAIQPTVLLGVGWGIACAMFYMISVAGAKAYGLTVHSAVDLYRLKLLEALSVKAPPSLEAEKRVWQEMTASFISNRVPDVGLASSAPSLILTPKTGNQ